MRQRRRSGRLASLALVAISALAVVAPASVFAATVGDLVGLAEAAPYLMKCTPAAAQVDCTAAASRLHPEWNARITPDTGQEKTLDTGARTGQLPLGASSRDWMIAMHRLACGGPKGAVDAFVNQVGDLTKSGTVGPASIGNCTFTGALTAPGTTAPVYVVSSVYVPPPPTPTPSPTPKPTPKPTVKPTAAPTASPTVAPRPTPTDAPSAGATAEASQTELPSDPPSLEPTAEAPSPAPSVGPSAVAGHSDAPTEPPAPASEPPAATTGPGASLPTFSGSVAGITDVNGDGGAIGGNLVLALLLLLIIGFIGELFNNTVENNYDEISGWFRKGPLGMVRRGLDRVRVNPPGRPGVLVFIGLTALISSFVDPGFGPNLRSVALFLGFLVGLIVVLASFKLPPILARRRRTGELGQLRPLPWALVIAGVFVLTSRLAHMQPGYLYGIVLGAIYVTDVSARDEGRETFFGAVWTLVAAVLAWVALNWLRGLGLPSDGFGVTLLSTAFAATLVAGLEAAAFALMPLRFLPGYVIYKWNRPAWAILWGISLFAFLHILIGPMSGYVSELSPESFSAALGVFAAFGALSIATWLYFRLRRTPMPATTEPA